MKKYFILIAVGMTFFSCSKVEVSQTDISIRGAYYVISSQWVGGSNNTGGVLPYCIVRSNIIQGDEIQWKIKKINQETEKGITYSTLTFENTDAIWKIQHPVNGDPINVIIDNPTHPDKNITLKVKINTAQNEYQ